MTPSSVSATPQTNWNVLIVDEHEMIRGVLSRIVQSWGFAAHAAGDLVGACRAVVTEGPFDVIICNYELPDGNAFDLVQWMHEQQLDVPTLVPYGALRPMSEPERGVEMLAKPFDPIDLKIAMDRAVSGGLDGNGGRAMRKRSSRARR